MKAARLVVVEHTEEATMPTPGTRREMLRQLDELADDVRWRAREVQGRTSAKSAPGAPYWPRDAGNIREGRSRALVARRPGSVLVVDGR